MKNIPKRKAGQAMTEYLIIVVLVVKSVPVTTVRISTVYLDLLLAKQPALAQEATPAQVDRVSLATELASRRSTQLQKQPITS